MPNYWLPLPVNWKLEDIQAALNIVVTALTFLASFTFVRTCWQRSARNVVKGKVVPLHSLLSINTPGEAFDAIYMLHRRLFTRRFIHIFIQCVVVICLSVTAILSGLISRFSTERGFILRDQDTPGLLAVRNITGFLLVTSEANNTFSQLETAGFPRTQLLDYIPDKSADWVYNPAQWNNSWSLTCKSTQRTPIQLKTVGNCTEDVFDEIPALRTAFPNLKSGHYDAQWDGWWDSDSDNDILMFVYGANKWNYSKTQDAWYSFSFNLGAIHLRNTPRVASNSTCAFGKGSINESSYTKIECDVKRRNDIQGYQYIASPDLIDGDSLVDGLVTYYGSRFEFQANTNAPVTLINPDDLIRFYQVFTAHKDIQKIIPTSRLLSVKVPTIMLSTIFLGIAISVALIIILALSNYAIFCIRHFDTMVTTPLSKLDWMMQSIESESRPLIDARGKYRRSVTVDTIGRTSGLSHSEMMNKEFDDATYGHRHTRTSFLKESTLATEYDASPELYQSDGIRYQHSPKFSRGSVSPSLAESAMSGAIYPLRTLSGYQHIDNRSSDRDALWPR